jgi:hypothetical protein
MATITAPDRSEAADYYFTYIDQVGEGDILAVLEGQAADALRLLDGISEERSLHRYAPDKWTLREVLNHVNDAERLFTFRALWFARGFESPLPSFDQTVASAAARANDRPWTDHVSEFRAIRAATVPFFKSLPADAWMRDGVASGSRFTVRALAYIVAGHVTHHLTGIRQRYL